MAFKGFVVALLAILFSLVSAAQNTPAHLAEYYGPDLLKSLQNKELADDDLRRSLLNIIAKNHHAVGYDEARRQIFGKLSLQQDGKEYFVKDVYCEQVYSHRDYPQLQFGPNTYPENGDIINTEHTWPQSRFTNRYPHVLQKSDIHHLFPSDSKMNSSRSALHFGDVVEKVEPLKCATAALGHAPTTGEIIFEPPPAHKGNVARAIFYFATRYEMKVSDQEEAFLRKWNQQDPVDQAEMNRNNEIEKIQGNRNPFIDFPELVDQVHNF
jgi:hypothetical protein